MLSGRSSGPYMPLPKKGSLWTFFNQLGRKGFSHNQEAPNHWTKTLPKVLAVILVALNHDKESRIVRRGGREKWMPLFGQMGKVAENERKNTVKKLMRCTKGNGLMRQGNSPPLSLLLPLLQLLPERRLLLETTSSPYPWLWVPLSQIQCQTTVPWTAFLNWPFAMEERERTPLNNE